MKLEATKALAAPISETLGTTSKVTAFRKEYTASQETTQSFHHIAPSQNADTAKGNKDGIHGTKAIRTGDSECSRVLSKTYSLSYSDTASTVNSLCISVDLMGRLEDLYELENTGFHLSLKNYLMSLYEEANHSIFPYTGPASFYELCRIVTKATHELFFRCD